MGKIEVGKYIDVGILERWVALRITEGNGKASAESEARRVAGGAWPSGE